MAEPSARFNHILAPVGKKSFLLMGQTDEEVEQNEVASSLNVFNHETRKWENYSIDEKDRPPGMSSGGHVSHENFIYAFGGREDGGTRRYNTLHKFDTVNLKWIVFPPTVNSSAEIPMPKAGCEPVVINDQFCLFGGYGTPAVRPVQPNSSFHLNEPVYDRGFTNEFHFYNLRNAAVPRWISGQISGDRPPPYLYYTLTLVDSRRAVMFGGNTKAGRMNDVYIMTVDGITVNFQKMRKYGPWPKKRSSHAACVLNYDQEFPQVLVAGGLDENTQPLGDLWLLSVDHGMWKKISDHNEYLHRWRLSMSCVSLESGTASVLVFGGVGKDGYKKSLTTLLEFNLQNDDVPEWTMEEPVILGSISRPGYHKPMPVTEDDGEYNLIY